MAMAAPLEDPVYSHHTEGPREAPALLLSLSGVTKRFGALVALADVSFDVAAGEVHCLLGENGAGKSTLCNVVFGVQRADAGQISLFGEPFRPRDPAHALASGIAMVHQHFSLVGRMSGVENLMLGRRETEAALRERTATLGARFGFGIELDRPVEQLSVGERQRLEIMKCLLREPRLLVLDEPTAVLPPGDVADLLDICRRVAEGGAGVVLVTHKLAEIARVADRTTVLRRGRVVESVPMQGADLSALVRSMVGREVRPLEVQRTSVTPGTRAKTPALSLENLTFRDAAGSERLDLSLRVDPGEIVALAGVEANGQSELGAILAGLVAPTSGRVVLNGRDVTGASPRELTRLGVGCVPEDRHAVGCHVDLSVAENLFLGRLERFTRFGLLQRGALRRAANELLQSFDVRGDADSPLGSLSGGNQQKVVLARELSLEPLVFLLAAQPTRGLDVGAVEAVYSEIRRARDRGAGVLLISSELDELLAVADRVLVIYRGRLVGELPAGSEQREAVGALMSGGSMPAARGAA
jgi:ABC-type uncharacterized transport system ATPase subunit